MAIDAANEPRRSTSACTASRPGGTDHHHRQTGGTGWAAGCLGGLFGRGLARSGRLFRWVARLADATAGPGRSGAAALGLRRGVAAADLLGGRATPVDGPPIRTRPG